MKSFKTYLSESRVKKVFISHLDKMKPLEFIAFVSKLDKKYKGVLSKEKLNITEKIDGSALRIGQDANGKAFIESSTSASMFNVGDFVKRDLSKGYSGVIGKKFDSLLKGFKTDKKVQGILSKYNNGNGIKVIGEILYTPMGIEDLETTIKFIRIQYDKDKLGTEWTFVPFKVTDMDGTPYDNTKEIFRAFYSISTKDRKYVAPTIKISSDIDISIEINKFKDEVLNKYRNLDSLLLSRKKVDKDLKDTVKDEILKYQTLLANKIVSHVNGGVFGKDFEGIVIEMPDGTILKVVSDKFKTSKFDNKLA